MPNCVENCVICNVDHSMRHINSVDIPEDVYDELKDNNFSLELDELERLVATANQFLAKCTRVKKAEVEISEGPLKLEGRMPFQLLKTVVKEARKSGKSYYAIVKAISDIPRLSKPSKTSLEHILKQLEKGTSNAAVRPHTSIGNTLHVSQVNSVICLYGRETILNEIYDNIEHDDVQESAPLKAMFVVGTGDDWPASILMRLKLELHDRRDRGDLQFKPENIHFFKISLNEKYLVAGDVEKNNSKLWIKTRRELLSGIMHSSGVNNMKEICFEYVAKSFKMASEPSLVFVCYTVSGICVDDNIANFLQNLYAEWRQVFDKVGKNKHHRMVLLIKLVGCNSKTRGIIGFRGFYLKKIVKIREYLQRKFEEKLKENKFHSDFVLLDKEDLTESMVADWMENLRKCVGVQVDEDDLITMVNKKLSPATGKKIPYLKFKEALHEGVVGLLKKVG